MLARVGSVVLVVVVMLAAAGRASAVDRAEELQARQAFASGRYDQALELFAKLYAETLHPVYLRNIGRCHQKMREPEKAIDAFHDYLGKARKVSADEKREIEGYIQEMEALRDERDRAARPPPTAPPPALPPATATAPQAAVALTAGPPPDAGHRPVYARWWF